MRILQLPSWYLPEGGQFCLHQSLALQEAGIDVHILANVVLPWKKYHFKRFGYSCKAFFTSEHNIPIYRNYAWQYPYLEIRNIHKWVKKTCAMYASYEAKYGKPDLIHVHSSMWGAYAAAEIKAKFGVPYVVTEHRGIFGSNSNFAKNLFREEYKPFLEKGFSEAAFIIPVSEQLEPKIKEYLQKKVEIKPISNILDTDYFSYIPRKRNTQESVRFISVNGFYAEKGYDILLPAFDLLCEQNPKVSLCIVGENFDKKAFNTIFKTIKHKDRIRFTGEISREGVKQELAKADVFVIASRVESQSVATLEAMSTGLPVVGTELIPSNILNEVSGYRVPIEDIRSLAKAMGEMCVNIERFDGEIISEQVKSIAGKEVVIKQLIEIYKTVLKNEKNPKSRVS